MSGGIQKAITATMLIMVATFSVYVILMSLALFNALAEKSEHWSKWSDPIDTRIDGIMLSRGIIQCRTNLDTGLIEYREIR